VTVSQSIKLSTRIVALSVYYLKEEKSLKALPDATLSLLALWSAWYLIYGESVVIPNITGLLMKKVKPFNM